MTLLNFWGNQLREELYFTVQDFSLFLCLVLNRLTLLNTLSHSTLECGKLRATNAKFARSKNPGSFWETAAQNLSGYSLSYTLHLSWNIGNILHWLSNLWSKASSSGDTIRGSSDVRGNKEVVIFLNSDERAFLDKDSIILK